MPGTITNLGQTLGGAVMGKPPKLLPKPGGFKPITVPKPPKPPKLPKPTGGHGLAPIENPGLVPDPTGTLGQMAPDPWTAALRDPRYMAASSGFNARRSDLYAQYGWIPDASSPTGYRLATATEQPYSIANQLAQALRSRSQDVMNQHNSRGILFSGSQVAGQEQALDAHNRGMAESYADFIRGLGQVTSDEGALQSEIYRDAIAQPAPDLELETKTYPEPEKPKAKTKPKAKKPKKPEVEFGDKTRNPAKVGVGDYLRGGK